MSFALIVLCCIELNSDSFGNRVFQEFGILGLLPSCFVFMFIMDLVGGSIKKVVSFGRCIYILSTSWLLMMKGTCGFFKRVVVKEIFWIRKYLIFGL